MIFRAVSFRCPNSTTTSYFRRGDSDRRDLYIGVANGEDSLWQGDGWLRGVESAPVAVIVVLEFIGVLLFGLDIVFVVSFVGRCALGYFLLALCGVAAAVTSIAAGIASRVHGLGNLVLKRCRYLDILLALT
jgi:hypothetical protein